MYHHTPSSLNLEIINIYKILAKLENAVPAGCIVIWTSPNSNPTNDDVPEGWLLCNGNKYNINSYPELFKAIGLAYTPTASNSVFQVPKINNPTVSAGSVGNLTYIIKT